MAYKPGSVLLHSCLRANVVQRLSFICAYCCQQTIAVYPPARASNPQTPVYMTLQLPERTAQDVTTPTGGLLPHLLTLTSLTRRLFSSTSTLPSPTPCTLTSGMLCVARTFLILHEGASDRPSNCFRLTKIVQAERKRKFICSFPRRRLSSSCEAD